MSAEENKALIRRLVEEVWNGKNVDAYDEFYAAEYQKNGEARTTEKDKEHMRTSFADVAYLRHTIEDMIAEGDKVTYRWIIRHTSQSTGKQFITRGITFYRIANGKIVDDWYSCDTAEDKPGSS